MTVDIDTGATETIEWYSPSDAVDAARARSLSREDPEALCDAVELTIRSSVRRRLMADVPVGTMCSGGLDSSLITAIATDLHPDIHAFNASVTDQPDVDEGPWARLVTDHLGIPLHTVQMGGDDWRAHLIDTVRHIEYPLTHESSVPMAQIADLARSRGVKVLLSGEGADELFGGYDWTHPRDRAAFLERRGSPRRAARGVRRLAQRAGLLRLNDPRGEPAPEVEAYELALEDRALSAYSHHRGARRRLEAGCLSNLGTYLPHLLNRQDKSTMMNSIETRVPFLDPEMVSLAVNLPLEVRVKPRRKEILRAVGGRHLPPDVGDRPKVGFGFDVRGYLVDAARTDFLLDGALRQLFEVDSAAWRDGVSGLEGHAALVFWTGEIWARALLEGESDQVIAQHLWRDGPSLNLV
jgi:asparagine synthase (glutamine-hydrolysing)